MFPPIVCTLLATVQVSKEIDTVLIIAVFWIRMLFEFAVYNIPALRYFHKDRFVEGCFWESLSEVNLSRLKLKKGG